MRHGAQLRAQALHRCRHKGGRKAGRQLAASDCFDRRNHVGGAAAGKIADHEVRGDRNPRLRELLLQPGHSISGADASGDGSNSV